MKLKDVPVGCIFSLKSGTVGIKVLRHGKDSDEQAIVLFREYYVQNFFPEETVTVWHGAELTLR